MCAGFPLSCSCEACFRSRQRRFESLCLSIGEGGNGKLCFLSPVLHSDEEW